MTAIFLLIAALMVAAALAFVLVPLLRHRGGASPSDTHARRLHALDAALAAGIIDAGEYAAKRATLDPTLSHAGAATAARPSRVAFAALILVTLLLPASALLLYRVVGTPQALDPASLAAEQDATPGQRGPEMEQAIAALVARLGQHPDDSEGWALLGRAYAATGTADKALDAFRHAHAATPANAAITVEYAQALALAAPGHRIEGEARSLLENVLTTDPGNQRALWLLGISDYQTAHYDAAIARWNTLLPLLAPDSDVLESVKKQIADAQALRDGTPGAPQDELAAVSPPTRIAPSGPPTASMPGGASTATAPAGLPVQAGAAHLTVAVSLDANLKDKADPDSTVFVYARAAQGPPMPLAIRRLKVVQLPLTVTLDDSMGMLPTMKLSMFAAVVVGARISKSGNALPHSGDLQALSAPIDTHRTTAVTLVIDQVVP